MLRLNAAKSFFEQYKNMPGVDIKLYESRTKDVDKAIKRAQKQLKQKKPSKKRDVLSRRSPHTGDT
jgi:hypothetical protein